MLEGFYISMGILVCVSGLLGAMAGAFIATTYTTQKLGDRIVQILTKVANDHK